MSSDPSRQGQGQYPPPQWEQPRGAYPPPPQAAPGGYRGPPPPQGYGTSPQAPGDMATLPPPQHPSQHPEMYRMPHDPYMQHQYAPDPRGPPPPHMQYPTQPAPRQRTAIACRYCRRRKIRCSGFDASDDGRCTNCQRFQQECIFTPVSSQAQAFVPAHTAYPHMRPGAGGRGPGPQGRPLYPQAPPIYGAHGQPLTPMSHDPNYPPPPQGYPMHYPPGPVYDDRGAPPPHGAPQDKVSLKRLRSTEFQPAVGVPPPAPPEGDESSHPHPDREPVSPGARQGSGGGGGYSYPDPSVVAPVSPSSSAQSYQTAPYPPQAGQPYYPPPQQGQQPPPQQPPGRRSSPGNSAYSYGEQRGSGSPHGSASSAAPYQYPPSGVHPPQVLPPQAEGRTPTPGNQNRGAAATATPTPTADGNGNGSARRGGMAVADILTPGQSSHDPSAGRSSADSNMLNALNKKM